MKAEHIALAAVAVGALVRAVKNGKLDVGSAYRPYLAMALGIASGVLNAMTLGTPWKEALIGGVLSGALAIAGHDTLIEGARDGKEL